VPGKHLPAIALGLAVVSVSFAAPLFRLADAPPLTASFWRLAFAVLLLLPFTRGSWADWRAFSRREWWWVVASGVALGFHFALWVTSLFLTTVAASVSLVTLQAIMVAVGGHFILRDRLTGAAWAGVAIATVGALTIGAGDLPAGSGNWSASRRAAYMLIGRRLRQRHGLITYVTPVYAVAALTMLASLLVVRQPLAAGPSEQFVWFVLLAAVPMLGGHTLGNWSLRYLHAHVVATWILLEPLGAAVLAWLIPSLHEVPSKWTILGGALVLMGAALTIRHGAHNSLEQPVTAA
jgi:drug/metabolite transporter (DMT)-like permease